MTRRWSVCGSAEVDRKPLIVTFCSSALFVSMPSSSRSVAPKKFGGPLTGLMSDNIFMNQSIAVVPSGCYGNIIHVFKRRPHNGWKRMKTAYCLLTIAAKQWEPWACFATTRWRGFKAGGIMWWQWHWTVFPATKGSLVPAWFLLMVVSGFCQGSRGFNVACHHLWENG